MVLRKASLLSCTYLSQTAILPGKIGTSRNTVRFGRTGLPSEGKKPLANNCVSCWQYNNRICITKIHKIKLIMIYKKILYKFYIKICFMP